SEPDWHQGECAADKYDWPFLDNHDHSLGQRSRLERPCFVCFFAVIRVSLAALVTIYLLVFLAAVFLVWLSSEWNRRRRERKAFRFRLRCVICGFEFEDRTDAMLPRCPRCGSLNERFKFERI